MLAIPSDIEGKRAYYGDVKDDFSKQNFHICGNWEYYEAFFDTVLEQDGGVTMYLRVPATVVSGKLDQDEAYLQFGQPFVLKHVMHTGFVEADTEFADMTGLNQFHKPRDPDDKIEHTSKWHKAAEGALEKIKPYVH